MIAKYKTPKVNFTQEPENQGVTYEEIKALAQHTYNSHHIGDNDIM